MPRIIVIWYAIVFFGFWAMATFAAIVAHYRILT